MKIIVNEKHMYLWSYTNETNKNIIFVLFHVNLCESNMKMLPQ